jgi:putative hydrolase of the HAD superfamily
MRKPDSAVFDFVLENSNTKATRSIFIDDLQENTNAAAKIGFKVWNLIPKQEDVIYLFDKFSI